MFFWSKIAFFFRLYKSQPIPTYQKHYVNQIESNLPILEINAPTNQNFKYIIL